MLTPSQLEDDTDEPPAGMYVFANKICRDDYDRLIKHLETRLEKLQNENSQLRWHVQDVRRILERIPDLPPKEKRMRWPDWLRAARKGKQP